MWSPALQSDSCNRKGTPKSFGVFMIGVLILPAAAADSSLVFIMSSLLLLLVALALDAISLSFPSTKERVEALGVAESRVL